MFNGKKPHGILLSEISFFGGRKGFPTGRRQELPLKHAFPRPTAVGRLAPPRIRLRGDGGLKVDQARRLKDLERENQRLRKAVADLTLDAMILKEAAKGNF